MRASAHCAWWMIGALAVLPAFAQDAPQTDGVTLSFETPLTPEESAILSNALIFDPAAMATPPKKPLRLPGMPDKGFDVTRTEKPDGSSTIVVKQPLQTEWSNSVGADFGAPKSGIGGAFDRPLPTARDNSGSGAAWASLGVSNIGSVDVRVDPYNEQGKFGTTLKQSIPFGGRFAVTLQDTYSVTETRGQPSAGPDDIPLMTQPSASTPITPQVFGNERAVKFNILPTGTTVGAGLATASNDPVTHNTISAEQKLYGPLQVTTAVTDFGQTTSNKSITAGFKLHW
ncbi:MAG TPA: hypothetical protein VLU23_19370 [Pseudolabrys sp.]|nr:hypothetical protein [Pseudolabrys sp.]